MSQEAPTQGMNHEQGIKYLADVAATYSNRLDEVARQPVAAFVNASITSIRDHIARQGDAIRELRKEIEGARLERSNAVPVEDSED